MFRAMTNIYWPVYQNLERELEELTFSIHIDDHQLSVYSTKITDLILRAAADIESISKELYKINGGTKIANLKFDDDALKHLNKLWKLENKVVVISSASCFQTNRELRPLVKTEPRTSSNTGRLTYTWNNAYQNLKHDRGNSISFGSLAYLFDIMAALFLLNLYYKDTVYPLERDHAGNSFSQALGSKIFSIKLKTGTSHDGVGNYIKADDFDEHVYFVNWTEDSGNNFTEASKKQNARMNELVLAHPKITKFISDGSLATYKGKNLAWDVLGKDEHLRLMKQAFREVPMSKASQQIQYEAILNKNQLPN